MMFTPFLMKTVDRRPTPERSTIAAAWDSGLILVCFCFSLSFFHQDVLSGYSVERMPRGRTCTIFPVIKKHKQDIWPLAGPRESKIVRKSQEAASPPPFISSVAVPPSLPLSPSFPPPMAKE